MEFINYVDNFHKSIQVPIDYENNRFVYKRAKILMEDTQKTSVKE